MLDSLPPEIRSRIYSFLFPNAKGGLVSLLVEKKRDWADQLGLPPFAVLRRDPRYVAYRQKCNDTKRGSDVWPDHVEDAFWQGMHRPLFSQNL